MSEISVIIEGKDAQQLEQGITAGDALKNLVSNKVRKQVVAVKVNDLSVDLSTQLDADCVFEPVLADSEEGLEMLRHSAAHVMALAVRQVFGEDVKVAIGPSIEDGFYYDFDRPEPFTPDDFEEIEKKMAEIVAARLPFERKEMSVAEAIGFFDQQGEKYKVELLKEMEGDSVSLYTQGSSTISHPLSVLMMTMGRLLLDSWAMTWLQKPKNRSPIKKFCLILNQKSSS